MNKQILAILVVLALATAVVAKRPAFIQIRRPIMKHVRETPVSHSTDILSKFHSALTLAQTAQDNGDNGDNEDVLEEWIDSYRQSVIEEGQAHAAIYQEQVQDCANEIPFRNNEINDATQSLAASNTQKAACISDQGTAQAILQVNELAQQKYGDDLAALRDTRARQQALYESRVQAHQDAQVVIDQALAIVAQFSVAVNTGANYAGFVQLGKKVNVLLMTAMKTGHIHLITPITNMFLQAKQNAFDPEVIDKLRGLFEDLLANLEQSLDELTFENDAEIAVFTTAEANLVALLDKLAAEEQDLEYHLVEMESCIEEESNIEIAAENKINRNQDLLDKAQALCASYDAQWESAQASRAGQLKMINALDQAVAQIRLLYPNKFKSLGNALGNAFDTFSSDQVVADDTNPFVEYTNAGAAYNGYQDQN